LFNTGVCEGVFVIGLFDEANVFNVTDAFRVGFVVEFCITSFISDAVPLTTNGCVAVVSKINNLNRFYNIYFWLPSSIENFKDLP
jgi:hypothetical protein